MKLQGGKRAATFVHVCNEGVSDGQQKATSVRHVEIQAGQAGQRIDNFLVTTLKGVPRTHIYRLLRKGEVRVNGGRIKPTYKVQVGDKLRLPPVRVSEREPGAVPPGAIAEVRERVLYEDDDLLVLDKPCGMAVHAGSGLSFGVIEALRAARPGEQLELAHRLDRETSGCLLLAKNRDTLQSLHAQLRDGGVDKTYLALTVGRWRERSRSVQASLRKGALEGGERMVQVDDDGKASVSHFTVRENFADAALVSVDIETGRTHQIRVHAEHIGHPLAGDDKYGRRNANRALRKLGLKRLFLHAWQLKLQLNGKSLRFEAPMPENLERVLSRLREVEQ